MNEQSQPKKNVNIKVTDETLKGSYANMMMVSHTQEEFILDFLNILPPNGILSSRIITSPGHIKRIIPALADNLKKYEAKFGVIKPAQAPTASEIGFKTQD